MKRNTLLVCALLLLCATPIQSGQKATDFKLPADYVVTEADWVDTARHKVGWPLGHINLRGKTLKSRNGVFPIHIMKAEVREFGDLIEKDDLVLRVNGTSLGKSGVDQVSTAVKRGQKLGIKVGLTRWRKGTVATVILDCKLLQRDIAIPNLTKGEKPGGTRDWALGPIGANGWGFSQRPGEGGSDQARQLLITLVDETGPATGKLNVGDVIIGVNGKDFARDARRVLAEAINTAEEETNKGLLKLKVWREGREYTVMLSLPVLGSYSTTAPFNCAKTEKIIDNAVVHMLEHKADRLKPGGWIHYVNGLGLLATGRDDVMPAVKELARKSLLKEGETLSVENNAQYVSWWWSYKTVFLCEYYLRTNDKAVLPTIEEYATKIAMGQSGVGTWGHAYAARANAGYLHGYLGGYGALNQTGLTLMIGLVLAEKCGITNQEIRDAIERGNQFFSYFIGKGTIPYGDHGAASWWYDDNGKSGAAAVLFDLLKNREGPHFFSEMVLGSAPSGREAGHCGHFWSHLWGGVGAARAGDKGLQIFMKEMNPIFTLERQHNGRFAFQENIGEKGHKGRPKGRWDCTGARLLQLCVPRRKLYITGRNTPRESHLSDDRVTQILKAGRIDVSKEARAALTITEILALLRDPLPPTRTIGVRALAEREVNCVDALLAMLDDENRFARYGAAEALGLVGFARKDAADKLIKLMEADDDIQFRTYAMGALTNTDMRLGLASVAEPAIPVLLKMAVEGSENDPRRILQLDIVKALFSNLQGAASRGLVPKHGLDGVDRSLLVPAIRSILTNDNGAARSTASSTVYPLLTADEREQLWGDVYRASRYISPSGIMFATGVRKEGIDLMSRHKIKEAMGLAAWYLRWQRGFGKGNGVQTALDAIERYGTHAKEVVPYLEEHINDFSGGGQGRRRTKSKPELVTKIRDTITRIKSSTETPEVNSISDQLHEQDLPPRDGP